MLHYVFVSAGTEEADVVSLLVTSTFSFFHYKVFVL